MKKQTVLVLGCTGMLGHKLVQILSRKSDYQVYGTIRAANSEKLGAPANVSIITGIHAESLDKISELVQRVQPIAVINCIGLVKQLPDGKLPIPNIKINALFPHQAAEIARAAGARFYHFSTDCVFSGTKGKNSETDPSDVDDYYGKAKSLGEVGTPGCLTIRSSIIGPERESCLGLFEWFCSQKGKRVKGYRKALYSGFTTSEMANIVIMLLEKFPQLSGVWNVASQPISKYEILCLINDALGLGIQIDEDINSAINRSLDGTRFETATGYHAPSWSDMIQSLANDPEVMNRFSAHHDRAFGKSQAHLPS